MDVVDRLIAYAGDLSTEGSLVTFDKVQGKGFLIPYDELRPIMRSAFQKHVRRGHEYAHRWGHYLLQHDAPYAWSTLYTIVVEDVGMANTKLCALMALATLKTWRTKVVNDDIGLFHGIIEAAIKGNKNRSPCELSVWCGAIDFNLGKDPTNEDLLDSLVLAPDHGEIHLHDRQEMYQAAVYLRARSRNGNDALLQQCLERMYEFHESEREARDALLTFERPIDSMCFGIHALSFRRGKLLPVETDPMLFTPIETNQGIPLCALDQHTDAGRKCIHNLTPLVCKDLKTDKSFIVEKTIGNILFFEEGCVVDRLERTYEERTIQVLQQQAYLSKNGLKSSQFVLDVRDATSERFDTLQQFRMEYLLNKVVKSK